MTTNDTAMYTIGGEATSDGKSFSTTVDSGTAATSSLNTSYGSDQAISPCGYSLATTLMDMPAELLHHIAGVLYVKEDCAAWHERSDGVIESASRKARLQGRKDVLALTSCSKHLRCLLFRSWMLKEAVVRLEEQELSDLASLPEELRHGVE